MARGLGLLSAISVEILRIMLALPQRVWWLSAVVLFALWALFHVMRSSIKVITHQKKDDLNDSSISYRMGRLGVLYRQITNARFGAYSQQAIRYSLRVLAVDLIGLKLDVPESEAFERLRKGDWSSDEWLKEYLDTERHLEQVGFWKRARRRFASAHGRIFLEETNKALDRLKDYGNFVVRRNPDGTSNSCD